jgi:hypothetical protein
MKTPRAPGRFESSAAITRLLTGIILGSFAPSCSDSGPTDTDSASIAISISASTLQVPSGGVGTVGVFLSRNGGYDRPVALALEDAPTGVIAAFDPVALTERMAGSTLTLLIAPGTNAGTSQLTIRATSDGAAEATASLVLTVIDDSASPFALTVDPATLIVQRGQTAQALVNIARIGAFTSNVSFTAIGAPAGVTATVTPATTAGSSATLSIGVAANAALGDYTLTINGSAAGWPDQVATLFLQVGSAPAGGSVAPDGIRRNSRPALVAFHLIETRGP